MDISVDDWDAVLDTNLKGAFLLTQAVARRMRDCGGGAIVNVASILSVCVANNVASYAVSKAGLVQLTKALALEWARYGIRVNALCPGLYRDRSQPGFLFDGIRRGADLADTAAAAGRPGGLMPHFCSFAPTPAAT